MDIPKKIKIFLWRAYNKGIPVGDELLKRLGNTDIRCKFCNFRQETALHLFKDCWWMAALWNSLGLNKSHLLIQFSNLADWLFYLSQALSDKDFKVAVIAYWYCWYNRNLLWYNENGMEIHVIHLKIKFYLKRIHEAHSGFQSYSQSAHMVWKPPHKDLIKINCDGAWDSRTSAGGIGSYLQGLHRCYNRRSFSAL